MTIYNLGNIKGEKGDRGECAPGPTGPPGVGIKSIEQITHKKFKFCLTDGSDYIIDYDTGSFDGMVVACDKSILSAADGEFATVSAQLTSGGFPVPFAGELITFEVRKQSDDSLVETLTDITDGTGKASVEYFGQGVGDLNIKVKCRSFIETYSIEDCIFAHSGEISYTSSNLQVSNALYELGNINDFDFIMEFDIKSNNVGGGLNIGASSQYTPPSTANYRMFIGTDTHQFNMNNRTDSSDHSNVGTVTDNVYYPMKLVKNGNSFTGYYGDNETVIATKNAVWISNYTAYDLYWMNWNGTNYVKNIKIKKL